jgi:beta-glucosidase
VTRSTRTFPPGFVWGTATSAYQVEGAPDADGKGPSIWDTFTTQPGRVRDGGTGLVACDQYHRYPEDIALMRELGVGGYRLSLAWSRLMPDGRTPNPAGIAHYRRLLEALRAAGIAPMVTLYHWDLPQALQDAGGWPHPGTADRFADYAALAARELGDLVGSWNTLNEPWVSSHLGYGTGVHAPGTADRSACYAADATLLRAHGLGLAALRAERPDVPVGIALNLAPIVPVVDDPADHAAARLIDADRNRLYLDPLLAGRLPEDLLDALGPDAPALTDADLATISAPLDYLGVNYYFRTHVTTHADLPAATPVRVPGHGVHQLAPDGVPRTALGWPVEPHGLTELLLRLRADYPRLPDVVITENGSAFADTIAPDGTVDDPDRERYLVDHLGALHDAITAGVPVTGYYTWSLLDNFEWALGYEARFGLVRVDYATQRRTLKASGRRFARVVREHGVG